MRHEIMTIEQKGSVITFTSSCNVLPLANSIAASLGHGRSHPQSVWHTTVSSRSSWSSAIAIGIPYCKRCPIDANSYYGFFLCINTRSNAPSSRSRTFTLVSRRQPLMIHRRHYNRIFHSKILVTTRIVVEAESWPLLVFSKS